MTNAEFNLWYSEAQNDFDVGKILFRKKKYNSASFHFVQAAEKAIKALLYHFNQKPWGHSILKLLDAYEKLGKILPKEIKTAANTLDPHYISSRYPDALPDYNPKEYYTQNLTKEIRTAARVILDFVNKEKEAIDANGSVR